MRSSHTLKGRARAETIAQAVAWEWGFSPTFATRPQKYFFYGNDIT